MRLHRKNFSHCFFVCFVRVGSKFFVRRAGSSLADSFTFSRARGIVGCVVVLASVIRLG